jgi:hypothetical protein
MQTLGAGVGETVSVGIGRGGGVGNPPGDVGVGMGAIAVETGFGVVLSAFEADGAGLADALPLGVGDGAPPGWLGSTAGTGRKMTTGVDVGTGSGGTTTSATLVTSTSEAKAMSSRATTAPLTSHPWHRSHPARY